jgi:uncharacterized protein (DUF1778 family)
VATARIVTTPKQARQARQRIDVRLRQDQKTCIEKAAGIKGVSLTDFIIQNAVENATRTIREHETWTLERPDAELFFEALLNPPAPGARLLSAAKRYKERSLQSE